VSVRGTEKDEALTIHGLNSARGYLQSKVADRVKTRYTPELSFEIDQGVHKSIEAARILREVIESENTEAEASLDDDSDVIVEKTISEQQPESSSADVQTTPDVDPSAPNEDV